jgi:hypothetical protein
MLDVSELVSCERKIEDILVELGARLRNQARPSPLKELDG